MVVPTIGGVLNKLYVTEGEHVTVGMPVAVVGSVTLYAKETGLMLEVPQVVGGYYNPGQTVAKIVVNQKMRVVSTIDETKGLAQVAIGQPVTFTVDAFPGRAYTGVVDEIAPASDEASLTFSISDKRPVKKFSIYTRFDQTKYPELKSGMSAKVWIHEL